MKMNKFLILFLGMLFLFGALAPVVSAADGNGFLQIWRNKTTDANVSWVDNNGNWNMLGNINLSGIAYGDGSGLTNLNVSSINLTGYVPYTGSLANVVLGDYNFSVGSSDFFVDASTGNVGIGNDLNVTGTGFFGWLGSLSERITGLFVVNADVSNNLSVGENLTVGGDLAVEGDVSVQGDVIVEGFVYSDVCPEGMAYIDKVGGYCIDKYEASMPGATGSVMGTSGEIANRNNPGTMKAESKAGVVPWVRVSQISARTACENAGKNLCSDAEWLGAANVQGQTYYLPTSLNVAPYYCVVSSSTYCVDNSYENGEACDTGTYSGGASGCYSEEGVYDMVGNVWEWTDEVIDVTNPDGVAGWKYANAEGGWSTSTSGLWNKYGNDGVYFPTSTTARAVLRGGRWNNGAYAGPFCAHLYYAPTSTSSIIGFRCCLALS